MRLLTIKNMQPQTLNFHGTYGATLSDMRDAMEAVRDNVTDTITLQIFEDKFKVYGGYRKYSVNDIANSGALPFAVDLDFKGPILGISKRF